MFFSKKSKEPIEVPVGFTDLHCHILAGVDDGASDDDHMYDLIRLEYDCGIRHICFTPHYNPALFTPKPDKIAESFAKAEVFMRPDTVERLRDGSCRPLGGTKTVLTEFHPTTTFDEMRMYVVKLLSNGYKPLVAHIERYDNLSDLDDIYELKSLGAKLQINTEAFESRRKKLIARLVEEGGIDVVADDRHNRERGNPDFASSYAYVAQKFGRRAADALFITRPLSILNISSK